MEINLKGKKAVVTGGNIGIGRAISRALACAGADVAITYFDDDEEAAKTIRAMGCECPYLHLDATNSAEVNQVFAEIANRLGGHIDILVNNAGHLVGRVPVAEMTDEFWRKVIEVNMTTAFFCSRAVIPLMNTGWGRVINMSSLAGHDGGGAGAVAYAAAKAGVAGFTRGLAKEMAAKGVTVNALAPGFIQGTPFHNTFTKPEVQQTIISKIPVGRAGTPDDVANTVLYLASDLASFVTGEVIEINGGVWFA
ncbi:MAG: SDR family oxidoreductase [Chloroflexi bacterium]|nr:SDR family oxidoreductase [Chloroflexota bacterium]